MRHKFKIDEEEGVQGAYANSDANLLLNVNLNPLSLQPGFPATFKEAFSITVKQALSKSWHCQRVGGVVVVI